jgi:acyl-CoA reductase-like NAD-dependent aldehyde dehydrogenase
MASIAPHPTLNAERHDYRLLIGRHLETSTEWLDVVNPATGKTFVRVPRATPAQLEMAVRAAKTAFESWSQTPIDQRRERLLQAADRIRDNCDRIAAVLTREQGKTLEAATQEVQFAEVFCRHFASMDLPMEITEDGATQRIELHRKPLGVVAAIAPWNFPFLIAVYKLSPALLAGNTLILKPAPTTPVTTLLLGELLYDVFPPGVVNTLVDNNELGPLLTAHPDVAKISFTGSTPTGKKIMGSAAPSLKRLTLELGGNDAAIVLEDADPKEIAPKIFGAAFLNSGQVCIAIKRLYVHDDIYEPMCTELAALARSAIVGDGMSPDTQFGPVQNHAQYRKVCSYLEDAHANGTVIAGGQITDGPGYYVPITVVRDIEDGSRLVDEEQFGPVLPVIRYRDVDDVISRVNASPYALGGSVWSANLARAHAVATRLDSGTVWINQHLAFGPHIPMPGTKESGIGVEWGREGLLEYTGMQVININK